MSKLGFTLVEALVSLLIVSGASMSCIYVANGYLKNAHLRDLHATELVQNIDTIEVIKATVRTKTELLDFANAHTDVVLTEIASNLYKVSVGDGRKLTVVVRVSE